MTKNVGLDMRIVNHFLLFVGVQTCITTIKKRERDLLYDPVIRLFGVYSKDSTT